MCVKCVWRRTTSVPYCAQVIRTPHAEAVIIPHNLALIEKLFYISGTQNIELGASRLDIY